MKNGLIIVVVILIVVIGGYFIYRSAYKSPSQNNSTTSTTTTQVSIKNLAFNPSSISVSTGAEVTFTNNDSASHTITADDNSFESGNLSKGQSYKKTFNKAGAYKYHCKIHSSMKGEVEVK